MYQVNAPRVVHETLEGETVVIDTLSGLYYTAVGNAAQLWQALAEGADPAMLAAACAEAGCSADAFAAFRDDLIASELLVPRAGGSVAVAPPALDAAPTPPALTRHDDLQDLIELDPIHEVDTAQGWPFRGPEAP
jgi:hypothetical protein